MTFQLTLTVLEDDKIGQGNFGSEAIPLKGISSSERQQLHATVLHLQQA